MNIRKSVSAKGQKIEVTEVYTKKSPWYFTLNINVENKKGSVLEQVHKKLNLPSGTFSLVCHGTNSEASISSEMARKHKLYSTDQIVKAFNAVELDQENNQ